MTTEPVYEVAALGVAALRNSGWIRRLNRSDWAKRRRGSRRCSGGRWTLRPAGGRFRETSPRTTTRTRLPLTAPVLEVLQRRRFGADDRYVFSNHRHACVSARVKKAASTLSNGLSFEFQAHDLRRTATSFMGEAGVDRFHIAHVPNHRSVTHSTVAAIYDRYRYDKEKRAALQTRAGIVAGIVGLQRKDQKRDAQRTCQINVDNRVVAAREDESERRLQQNRNSTLLKECEDIVHRFRLLGAICSVALWHHDHGRTSEPG